MSSVYDPQAFHRDGTPKRKYEIDEVDQKRLALQAVIGLMAVNVVVLLKNVLFGKAYSRDEAGAGPSVQGASPNALSVDSLLDDANDRAAGQSPDAESEAPHNDSRLGSLKNASHLSSDGTPPERRSAAGGPPLLLPSNANDNELLYGARPGTTVTAFNRADGDTIGGAASDSNTSDEADEREDDDDDREVPPRANRLPEVSGPVLLPGILPNVIVIIAFADLLHNATDADGDNLVVMNLQSSSGVLQLLPNGGGWVFRPDANDTTFVTFSYSVSDGMGAVAQTAMLDLLLPDDGVIRGTDGDDRIVGSEGDDVIDALCGDDVIIGRNGDDVIYGGSGNDRIFGEGGDDLIFAGAGDDVVLGGAGDDVVFGGAGDDVIFGDDGSDALYGEDGNDIIAGGADDDIVMGGYGNDRLVGDAGVDFIDGGDGDDALDGGVGNDILIGNSGNDQIEGGAGDDLIRASTQDNEDDIDGGEGIDTYDTSSTEAALYVSLDEGWAVSAETGRDELQSIENVKSGNGNDFILGSEAANMIDAGGGADVIIAGEGADVVIAGSGDDLIVATVSDGHDQYEGGEGTDTYDASASSDHSVVNFLVGIARGDGIGEDTLSGIENVLTGCGDDLIVGDASANAIDAGAGDDIVSAGDGDDYIYASMNDGDDVYDGGTGRDAYDLSATSANATIDLLSGLAESSETGSDTILNIEDVIGSSGNDIIFASNDSNVLIGGDGDDIFVFRSAAEVGRGSGSRDRILDFEIGDRIDIRDIADEIYEDLQNAFTDSVTRRFMLISSQDDFYAPAQIRFKYDDIDNVTVLQGNVDRVFDVDFELELTGYHEMQYEYFRQ